MKRVAFAAIAGIALVAAYGTSKAAPIAPLPGAITANTENVVQAHYYRHHYYPYYHAHHYYHHRYWRHHHWYYW